MKKATTPEQFEKEMRCIHDEFGGDKEGVHSQMDNLLCRVLSELGYDAGVKIFESEDKWYA